MERVYNERGSVISDKLYNWMERHFNRDNHPKYKKYFSEWFKNIMPNQIPGFEQDMRLEEIFIEGK